MNALVVLLALLTGFLTGAAFAFLRVPIPAPPALPGVMGIVGIYLGYKAIQLAGVGFDLLGALGLT
ncbi:MAG: XapX domain-containing protein [Haloferacaceae archaeon]